MPQPDNPVWEDWSKVIDKLKIDIDTTLIGHSCGAGFWIKYLSLHKDIKAGKVILVAPWLDPDGDETESFFDNYKMDPNLSKRTKGLIIFNSDNDMGNVLKSVAEIRENIKDVHYKEFHKYSHFTYLQMRTHKFPELLTEVLSGQK
jgi:predicted alpha/beta hydrolase family esterase